MADLYALSLTVDPSGAVTGFGEFGRAADRSAKSAEQAQKRTSAAVDTIGRDIKRILGALGGLLGLNQLREYADTWKLIEGRLKLVTTSTANLKGVQAALFQTAQQTRTSFEATADLYARMARGSKTLGLSQADLLTVTKAVAQSFAVSGATAQETSAAIMQLGQAMASGTLQGDELRAVLENAPRLAQAISDSMGITVGQLRAAAAQGKITSAEIAKAIMAQSSTINREYQQLPATIGQAFTTIGNTAMKLVGQFDAATGASASVVAMMGWIGTHGGEVAGAIAGIGTATVLAGTAWKVYANWTKIAVAWNAVLAAGTTIQSFITLALSVRRVADAMALLSLVGKGAAGAAVAVVAIAAGWYAYQQVLEKVNQSTKEFEASLGQIGTTAGGTGGPTAMTKEMQALEDKITDVRREVQALVPALGAAALMYLDVGKAAGEAAEESAQLTEEIARETQGMNPAQAARMRDLLIRRQQIAAMLDEAKALREAEDARDAELRTLRQERVEAVGTRAEQAKALAFREYLNRVLDTSRERYESVAEAMRQTARAAYEIKASGLDTAAMLERSIAGITPAVVRKATTNPTPTRTQATIDHEAAAERMRELYSNALRQVQEAFGRTYDDILARGQFTWRALAESFRSLMGNAISAIAAAMTAKALGLDKVLDALRDPNTSITDALKKLSPAQKGALGGLAGFGVGMGIGSASGDRTTGVLGGAMGGAMAGSAFGLPGAIVGGLAGAVGGLFGASEAQKRAADELRKAAEGMRDGVKAYVAGAGGDSYMAQMARIDADAKKLVDQLNDLAAKHGISTTEQIALGQQIFSGTQKRKDAVNREFSLGLQSAQADLTARGLRASGRTREADDFRFSQQQSDEVRQFIERFQGVEGSDATLKQLLGVQGQEREARERARQQEMQSAKDEIEVRALAAQGRNDEAEAMRRQMEAAQQIRDAEAQGLDAVTIARLKEVQAMEAAAAAAEKASAARRALEDLDVRRMEATGQGSAADDLRFALQQARELEDAKKSGASADYIAKLEEVLRLEKQRRDQEAAGSLVDNVMAADARSVSLDGGRSLQTLTVTQGDTLIGYAAAQTNYQARMVMLLERMAGSSLGATVSVGGTDTGAVNRWLGTQQAEARMFLGARRSS